LRVACHHLTRRALFCSLGPTKWDWFPNQNLTGVGAGAALTASLDDGGFGGDTDGFYQRRGCGLSKVSGYGRVGHAHDP